MAAVFQRYFQNIDPGSTVLLNIESVNILDLNPPAPVQGVGTSTAMIVGEFEDGPYNTPTAVISSSDFPNVWGGFGYTVNNVPAQYPSAQTRFADAQPFAEYWNGNGFLALNGKQFGGLVVTRVNTSTGAVEFTLEASLVGAVSFSYPMVTGDLITIVLNGGGPVTATFTGVAGTVTGSSATYSGLAGGTATFSYDGNPSFVVYFQVGDTTASAAVARINQYAGFAFAVVSSGQVELTGVVPGTSGNVDVISGSAGVLTALGLTPALTAGTGNVGNIRAVTFAEVQSIIQTALSSNVSVYLDSNAALNLANTETPGTGTIEVTVLTAASLGFPVGVTASAAAQALVAAGNGAKIPAGTVVTDGGSNVFVTTVSTPLTATLGAGPYAIPVRYAVDNTASGAAGVLAGAATTLPYPPLVGSFAVQNVLPIGAQMTDSQVDAAYAAAYATTISINGAGKGVNLSWAARHSNVVRQQANNNAILATSNGCAGRMCAVSPPLNTPETTALSSIAAPGVGAYRSQRTVYCYPGFNTFVPSIGAVGLSGGAGFTATGNIDQTSDGWLISICSQLPPEENPGQDTQFTSSVNSIELGANVQGFGLPDYIAFKAAGICAARFDTDNGVAIFQSGVTTVNPATNPQLVRIARRRMADFIEGSLAQIAGPFGKQLNTLQRRLALAGEFRSFLGGLLGTAAGNGQRIEGYDVNEFSGNTLQLLQQGLFRIIVNVTTLTTLDSIVIQADIGDQVVTTVTLPAAA
jgi:hypothetical protein